MRNFFNLYLPIVDEWAIHNNSSIPLEVIAEKLPNKKIKIINTETWKKLQERYFNGDSYE